MRRIIVSKATFTSQKSFDKNFAAINEIKPVLTFYKTIYVGFTVLELSKWLMYDFHYNFIKRILMLIYCLLIQTMLLMKSNQKIFMKKHLYQDIYKYKHLFNFSEYQSNFFDLTNKKVSGKMNDDFKGIPISKFIGLKSKIYFIVSDDDKEVNTATKRSDSFFSFKVFYYYVHSTVFLTSLITKTSSGQVGA